ncbi:MAG: hypothetical protein IKC71_04975 [Clostridia bacterium]|nr:hypothetical protein [Clostridia bacterium]
MYCPNCNAKLNDNIEVCPYCREKTGYVKPEAKSRAGSIPIWFWILCFILPPVGIVCFIIARKTAKQVLLTEEEFNGLGENAEKLATLNKIYAVDLTTLTYEEYVSIFDKTRKKSTDQMLSCKEAFAYGLVFYFLAGAIAFIVWATINGYNPNGQFGDI